MFQPERACSSLSTGASLPYASSSASMRIGERQGLMQVRYLTYIDAGAQG